MANNVVEEKEMVLNIVEHTLKAYHTVEFLLNHPKTHKTVQVWIQEIHGISYYIDKFNNVYDHHDIVNNRKDPKIIAKYTNEGGSYNIPSLFNKK